MERSELLIFGFLDHPRNTQVVVRGFLFLFTRVLCPSSLKNSGVIPGKLAIAGATRNPGPHKFLNELSETLHDRRLKR